MSATSKIQTKTPVKLFNKATDIKKKTYHIWINGEVDAVKLV